MTENPWRRRSIEDNPYYWTVFQLTGVSRSETSSRRIAEKVRDVMNVLERRPREVCGQELTVADVNAARKAFGKTFVRICDELLEHHPEQPVTKSLEKFQGEFPSPDAQSFAESKLRHLGFLVLWAKSLIEEHLAQLPPPALKPSPSKWEIIPPVREG